ncbi:hypothetical protein [Luethyella okanaganae]|uniref:Uncharacterized protein n=1 Tax=Luethyella okanaganae TaxID=69372 RepID=A0ABW1VJS5_9MICO
MDIALWSALAVALGAASVLLLAASIWLRQPRYRRSQPELGRRPSCVIRDIDARKA